MSHQNPQPTEFKVYIQHPFARMPSKSHRDDVGYDLFSCEWETILPKQWKSIKTGIHFDAPDGWDAHIYPQAELAATKGVTILNAPAIVGFGDYGEILILLYNTGEFPYDIAPGDKIARFNIQPSYRLLLSEIEAPPLKMTPQ